MKRGQSSIEFLIIVGAVLLFFVGFLFAVETGISDRLREDKNRIVRDIALIVQDEVSLAFESSEGYYREFSLPLKVANLDYEISIVDNFVFVRTTNGRYATSYPVLNVTGSPLIGDNVIRKQDGVVYLNS